MARAARTKLLKHTGIENSIIFINCGGASDCIRELCTGECMGIVSQLTDFQMEKKMTSIHAC
jgi:hypothetical protein